MSLNPKISHNEHRKTLICIGGVMPEFHYFTYVLLQTPIMSEEADLYDEEIAAFWKKLFGGKSVIRFIDHELIDSDNGVFSYSFEVPEMAYNNFRKTLALYAVENEINIEFQAKELAEVRYV